MSTSSSPSDTSSKPAAKTTSSATTTPAQAVERIVAVDAIIEALRAKREGLRCPNSRRGLMNEISEQLDERLRLMAIRDGHPFSAGAMPPKPAAAAEVAPLKAAA